MLRHFFSIRGYFLSSILAGVLLFTLFFPFVVYGASTDLPTDKAPVFDPQLEISIPGLDFTSAEDVRDTAHIAKDGSTYITIPFLGEYISAIFTYGVAVSTILAMFMCLIGGLQWMVSRGDGPAIQAAKSRMVKAIIGLLLALGSYTILYTINPELIKFRNLRVLYVRQIDLSKYIVALVGEGGTVTPITDPNVHHAKPGAKNQKLTDEMMIDIADRMGIDKCIVLSTIKKESGGNLHLIGHDENFPVTRRGKICPTVSARKSFLSHGRTFKNVGFTPIPLDTYNPCIHNNYKVSGKIIKNDDKFDLNSPPEYGLDWRYSHGIGFGQITIFPDPKKSSWNSQINGPNGPEWARKIIDRWYTVSDLLNADKQLEATILLMNHVYKAAKGDVENFFKRSLERVS